MSDILKMDESTDDLCSSHILSEIPEKILDPIEPIPFIPGSKFIKKVRNWFGLVAQTSWFWQSLIFWVNFDRKMLDFITTVKTVNDGRY